LGKFNYLDTNQKYTLENILIDTGCNTLAIINSTIIKKYNLPIKNLSTPIIPILADTSTTKSPILYITEPIQIQFIDKNSNLVLSDSPIQFLVLDMMYDIILGLPWLQTVQPKINWNDLTLIPTRQPCTLALNNLTSGITAEFSTYVKEYTPSDIPLNPQGIPLKYTAFANIFQEKNNEAAPLPPHRPYDLAINLDLNNPLPPSPKIYPLAPIQEKILKDYIDKALIKGWISNSTAAYAEPIFIVPKPNNEGRACINYKNTNLRSEKITYPLPIVQDLLDKLGTAKVFSRLDLPDAYHLVRIKAGDEYKTAFRCKFGLFQYNVVSFGLTNAPAVFQFFLNDIFKDMINKFVVIYLDDILIFSDDENIHESHVTQVLQRLQDHHLVVNPKKCSFNVKSIDFLGYIVTVGKGLSMNPEKVRAITEWKAPNTVKQLQSFLGFANFYRRFILHYSKLIKPLSRLISKDVKFNWTPECDDTFNQLKKAFTTEPILRIFDFTKSCILETDSSDYAIGSILSQEQDGVFHPIAYHSRQLLAHEINYDIYDKELLAIIDSIKKFRHYLIGVPTEFIIYTDHNNLVKFESSQQLNRRQFRWSQMLSEYNFCVVHRPGKLSEKPDALSRKAEYSDIHKSKNFLRLFQRFPIDEFTPLTPTADLVPARTLTPTLGEAPLHALTTNINLESLNIKESISKVDKVPSYTLVPNLTQVPSCTLAPTTTSVPFSTMDLNQVEMTTFDFATNFLEKVKLAITELPSHYFHGKEGYTFQDNLYYYNNKIFIPTDILQQEIFAIRHNKPTAGHYGILKTLQLVSRNYYWPGMKRIITTYINGCHTCRLNKSTKHKKYGLLQPLPIPKQRWQDLSMDFITDLPLSQAFDALYIVKDRLTKQAHFIPCTKAITAEQTAHLFLKEIVRLHGVPLSIVSDRGPQFKAKFFREFFKVLGTATHLSTAFHPETDGSTEVLNQTVEQYIRIFGTYHQDDWTKHLSLAEFTYNNTVNSTTLLTPFYSNLGYHPLMDFHDIPLTVPAVLEQTTLLKDILLELTTNLVKAQESYSLQANKHRQTPPTTIAPGAQVFLNRKNISLKFGIKKFAQKFFGPFQVLEQINPVTFKLALPASLPIHPVFHVSLLEPAPLDAYPDQNSIPAPPIQVADTLEFEVESILAVRGTGKKKKYLVKWLGYDESENSWEPLSHLTHCKELLYSFHHPTSTPSFTL
jgi:hypothetical protein